MSGERTCVRCGRFGNDSEGTECPGCGFGEFWSGRVTMSTFTPQPNGHRINYAANWPENEHLRMAADVTAEAKVRDLIAERDRLRQQVDRAPRSEAVKFVAAALGDEPSPFADKSAPSGGHKKAGRAHFGRVELRELLDLIYGGPPASDSERIK